jgi:hypothetical protein
METAKLVVTQESLRDLALRDAGLLGVVDVSDVMGTLNDLKNQVTGWRFVWISKKTDGPLKRGLIKAIPTSFENKTMMEKALTTRLIRRRHLHPYYASGVIRIASKIRAGMSERVIDFALDFIQNHPDMGLGDDEDAFPNLVKSLKIDTTLSVKSLLLARKMIPKVRILLAHKPESFKSKAPNLQKKNDVPEA